MILIERKIGFIFCLTLCLFFRRVLLLVLVCGILLTSACSSEAEEKIGPPPEDVLSSKDWLQVYQEPEGTLWYIRLRDRGQGKSDMPVKAWLKSNHSRDVSAEHHEAMSYIAFECTDEQVSFLSLTKYDDYGSIIDTSDSGFIHLIPIPARSGTVEGEALKAVCSQ